MQVAGLSPGRQHPGVRGVVGEVRPAHAPGAPHGPGVALVEVAPVAEGGGGVGVGGVVVGDGADVERRRT